MFKDRFVAHIDILGMSNLVERNPEKARGILYDLVRIEKHLNHAAFYDEIRKTVIEPRTVVFSDTVLLFTTTDGNSDKEHNNDFHAFITWVSKFFQDTLLLGIPVRIGISYGAFYYNTHESIYLGEALTEAYKVGEEAQWVGVVLSNRAFEKARLINTQTIHDTPVVLKWPVKLKNQTADMGVLNWPALINKDKVSITPPISSEEVYNFFSNTFGEFTELSSYVTDKYKNTADFINAMLYQI